MPPPDKTPAKQRLLLPSEQIHAMALAFGDEPGYKLLDGPALTFGEWDEHATRLARGLVAAGVEPGSRVGIHLEPANALRWVAAYAAIHRAGGVAIPFNAQLTKPEIERMVDHSGAAAVFAEESLLPRYEGGRPELLVAVPAADADATGVIGSSQNAKQRVVRWSELMESDPEYFQVPRDPSDLAEILYTSGTTGNPKAVAVRHDNASMVPFHKPTWSGAGWLHCSPPYTFAGLSFVYTPMKLGMLAIYLPRFDATRWLDGVERERPVSVFLVPAMAALLLEHPRFETADLSSVQVCSIGSAPLAPFVLERLQERMPTAALSNNYGMTEAGSVYCLMPPGEAVKRPGSVGMPMPPAEVRCLDADGKQLGPGEIGDVFLRIPGRPREYYGDPEASAQIWVDGWLVTGDVGKLDEDGYLYIVGRSKDVIIRGGNNIHPTDVEYAIEAHPAVREVAVIGVPHPVLGEDLVAFVVVRPEDGVDADDLRAHTLERLAAYKVPRRWEFVEQLPRNATGKVIKGELRDRLAAEDAATGNSVS